MTVTGSLRYESGHLWYEAEAGGYVYAGHVQEPGFFDRLWQTLFG